MYIWFFLIGLCVMLFNILVLFIVILNINVYNVSKLYWSFYDFGVW